MTREETVGSPIRAAVKDYLAVRRALGFKLERSGQLLEQFARYAERVDLSVLTIDAALSWAQQPASADPAWWSTRLGVVRQFARWYVAFDPATEVPPTDLLAQHSRRAEPFPFSDENIAALMTAAGTLQPPLRAATYQTLIGLLVVTGLRVGEVIGLDRDDVDLAEGVLTIRGTKFAKSREVPLHPSTVEALAGYARARKQQSGPVKSPAFLLSTAGTRMIYKNVHQTWLKLTQQAGLQPLSPRCRPRPHDLRHQFAITTLTDWYHDGGDIAARLPLLSTYLGHADPASTYWYLRADPQLLALATQRLDRRSRP